jgi:hypothetical protein
MGKLTLKCRRHEANNCLRGCRKPSRGTRLNASSDYGYFDASNVLTTYLIGQMYEGSPEVQVNESSYQEASFTDPSSYGSSYGGGDFGSSSSGGGSSSYDSGSSSSDSGSW